MSTAWVWRFSLSISPSMCDWDLATEHEDEMVVEDNG